MIFSRLYPFVFALFPILSLYLVNHNEVDFSEVLSTSFFVLLITSAIYVISFIPTKNSSKAALITFLCLFFTFSFGPVFSSISVFLPRERFLNLYFIFLVMWLFMFGFLLVRTFIKTSPQIINKYLSYVSLYLIIVVLTNIIRFQPWVRNYPSQSRPQTQISLSWTGPDSAKPDIYYIIMDRYARADILKKNYDFDNTQFIDFLKEKGFYVADQSRSNYLKTAHSLASSLNMEYVNHLTDEYGENSADWQILYQLFDNNQVARSLSRAGYKYIHIGSWWEPTRKSNIADVNINLGYLSEFGENLFSNTVFYPIKFLFLSEGLRRDQYNRTLYELDYLKNIPLDRTPTYTFAHFLITHLPYVFDQQGRYLDSASQALIGNKDTYPIEVANANKLLTELISQILDKSEIKPIIIIQSDEGNYPQSVSQYDNNFNWFKATPDLVDEKTAILNAVYVPGLPKDLFYPTITPVNTFRLVFNQVFNSQLPLLPDESYLTQDNLHLFKFKKITASDSQSEH